MATRSRHPPGYYKSLFAEGDDSHFKSKYRPETRPVVMGTYDVERVVAKRKHGRKFQYYVKWKNWSSTENTWEPEEHLPSELISAFENQQPEKIRVDEARERLAVLFERGIKAQLQYEESLIMRHDVIRALFPKMPSDVRANPHLANADELKAAGLEPFLERYLTVTGGQCCVATPVRIKLLLGRAPSFLDETGAKAKSRPLEKVKVKFAKVHRAGRSY